MILQLTVHTEMPEILHRGDVSVLELSTRKDIVSVCQASGTTRTEYSRRAALTLISHLFGLLISKLCLILCQPRLMHVGISGRYLRRGVTEIYFRKYAGLLPAGPDALLEGARVALATFLLLIHTNHLMFKVCVYETAYLMSMKSVWGELVANGRRGARMS